MAGEAAEFRWNERRGCGFRGLRWVRRLIPASKEHRLLAPLRRGALFWARQQKPRLGGRGLVEVRMRRKPTPVVGGSGRLLCTAADSAASGFSKSGYGFGPKLGPSARRQMQEFSTEKFHGVASLVFAMSQIQAWSSTTKFVQSPNPSRPRGTRGNALRSDAPRTRSRQRRSR